MKTWPLIELMALGTTCAAAAGALLAKAAHRRNARRQAAQDTDILVIGAEEINHWATVQELRYAYPAKQGGTSTVNPPQLGPHGSANATLTLTERHHRHGQPAPIHTVTTADIAAARLAVQDQIPADAEASYIADVLIQQAVLGQHRHLHPSARLNMDRITAMVKAAGIDAYVEQTGGGCATIIVGAGKLPATDDRESSYDAYVLAGPGWFDWDTTPATAYASRNEFYIGPDDLAAADTWSPPLGGTIADTEAACAAHIIATIKSFTRPTQ